MSSTHNVLDIEQAAKYLNVKLSRMRTAVLKKEIPYFKIGRLVRFYKEDLDRWIEEQRRKNRQKF